MFDIAQFLTDSSTGSVGTATSGGSGSGISRVAVIFMRAANIARRRIEDGVRCPGFTEIMKNGTNSEDVARLETLLTITSGFKGAINTVFDDATTLALKAFQTSKGIEQTGVYGAQTHTAMSQVCRDLNTTTTI
jgi:murein L,D-transpeptidase YcbB/YkuD